MFLGLINFSDCSIFRFLKMLETSALRAFKAVIRLTVHRRSEVLPGRRTMVFWIHSSILFVLVSVRLHRDTLMYPGMCRMTSYEEKKNALGMPERLLSEMVRRVIKWSFASCPLRAIPGQSCFRCNWGADMSDAWQLQKFFLRNFLQFALS